MLKNKEIASLRKSYKELDLNENEIDKDPFKQLAKWLNEAVASEITEPNSMVLSTATKEGIPSSRVVLLKAIDEKGLAFYTNYESQKAKELIENPNASLLFFWRDLGRQIRITGNVEKTGKEESEEYFITRPYLSRIAAWASKQSSILKNRKELQDKFEELKNIYKEEVPLPPFWGGFRIIPHYFEFWQGRENRLHDRIAYSKKENNWEIFRLSP